MSRSDAEALIARAVAAGVELWREGVELRFRAPRGALAADLRDALRASKAELLDVMREGERHLFTSDSQRRVWLADRMEPGSPAYNVPMAAIRLRGALDVDRLGAALDALLARHEALRARFPAMAAEPVQVIPPESSVPLRRVDLTPVPADEREAAAWRAVREDVQRPFDVTVGSLLRTSLFALSDEEHWLAVTMHHVVADVWSMRLFLSDLVEEYAASVDGRAVSTVPPAAGFRDVLHARRGTQSAELAEGLRYWRGALADVPPRLDLPLDRPRPERRGLSGEHAAQMLDAETWEAVREYARRREATPFMVLFAAFGAWLSRHTGQCDLLTGCPVWGRPDADSASLVGLFADTLPLRLSTAGDPSFDELVERARATTLDAYRHSSVPLARILEDLRSGRAGEGPIVSVLFEVLAFGAELRATGGGIEFESMPLERGATDVDLFFIVSPESGGVRLWLEYARDVFDAGTVHEMLARFERLLVAALATPAARSSALAWDTSTDAARRREYGERGDNRARAAYLLGTEDVERVVVVDAGEAPVPAGCVGDVVAFVGGTRRGLDRRGRFGDGGALELRGRVSRAVHVRGTRVDRDEMESVLRDDPSVEDAAVLVRDDRELVAFVVARGPLPAERLAARVRARGTHGLAPVAMVPVSRLPRTADGSVDEDALARLPVVGDAEVEAARHRLAEQTGAPVDVAIEVPRPRPERVHVDEVLGAPADVGVATAHAAEVAEEPAAAAAGPPAFVEGGAPINGGDVRTLAEMLLARASRTPAPEIVFVEGASVTRTTCAELLDRALACGGGLQAAGIAGGIVVLMLDEPREIVAAFWGAVVAGAAPLIVPPPADEGDAEAWARIRALLESLGRPAVVTSRRRVASLRDAWVGSVLDVETLAEGPPLREPATVDPSSTAFLTLTSGSTGVPKAVRLTHHGLLARARGTDRRAGFTSDDVILNWLPLDHIG